MRRRQPEAAIQRAIVRFLAVALDGNAMFYAVPNGGRRSKIEAAIMAGLGTVAGVPDLAVLDGGRSLFLEVKAPGGTITERQDECHRRIRRAGGDVAVVRSLDEAIGALRWWAVPLRCGDQGVPPPLLLREAVTDERKVLQ